MNIRDLQYLVALADLEHFSKAAESCHVSQPTLSMQLKKLEEFLDVQLFERTNKQVRITKVGEEIVEHARVIIRHTEEIKELSKVHQDPFSGELKLGIFPTLSPYLLPHIIPEISTLYPQLRLLLIEESTDAIHEKVRNGDLDVAVITLPIDLHGLEMQKIYAEPFYLAVTNKHRLATRTSITQEDLKGESLLLLEDGHCLRDQALEVCMLIGADEQQDFRATSLETLRQMVVANAGVTLIPHLATLSDQTLAYIPFDDPKPCRIIGMVWRKQSAKKEVIEAIGELILETTEKLVSRE